LAYFNKIFANHLNSVGDVLVFVSYSYLAIRLDCLLSYSIAKLIGQLNMWKYALIPAKTID